MAFNAEGTRPGVIGVQRRVRDPAEFGKKHLRHRYGIGQKESHKWLKSFKAVAEVQAVHVPRRKRRPAREAKLGIRFAEVRPRNNLREKLRLDKLVKNQTLFFHKVKACSDYKVFENFFKVG